VPRPNVFSVEYRGLDAPWWEGVAARTATDGPIVEAGHVAVPDGPGLGIAIDRDGVEGRLIDGSEYVLSGWFSWCSPVAVVGEPKPRSIRFADRNTDDKEGKQRPGREYADHNRWNRERRPEDEAHKPRDPDPRRDREEQRGPDFPPCGPAHTPTRGAASKCLPPQSKARSIQSSCASVIRPWW